MEVTLSAARAGPDRSHTGRAFALDESPVSCALHAVRNRNSDSLVSGLLANWKVPLLA